MSACAKLDRLIRALQIQPGIGHRSATRIAYTLLDRRRTDAIELGNIIIDAMQSIKLCPNCQNYCDNGGLCRICANEERKKAKQLCVVESPSDVEAIEQSNTFFGNYFVLHGHLSPIDGIGPRELNLDLLNSLLAQGLYEELILATNPTVEGDATAAFIANMASRYPTLKITQIAAGVPLGGGIDNIDGKTLASSLSNRREIEL